MSTVPVALAEPSFQAATSSAEGDLIDDLRKKCGLVIQGIDWVVQKITGWSMVEAIFNPLLGDYSAVDAMSQNWQTLSTSFGAIGDNYTSLQSAVPSVWSGSEAGDRAQQRLADFADGNRTQAEASTLISTALRDMLTAVKAAAEVVAEALSMVDELVMKLISGPLGVLGEIARGGATVRRVASLVQHAIRVIERLRDIVPPLLQALSALSAMLKGMRIVFQFAGMGTNANAGSKVDDVAQAGF